MTGHTSAPQSSHAVSRIVDLTIPIASGMSAYPGEPTARFESFTSLSADGVEMATVHLFSQLATHVDAPRHFLAAGATIDEIDLYACVGPAVVVDAKGRPAIGPEDLAPYEQDIRSSGRVLIATGWDAHLGSDDYYTHLPVITPAAARTVVAWGVRFLGMDTPTPSLDAQRELHEILLQAGVVLAESLVNITALGTRVVFLVCLPLPLVGLDGSPARVIAIVSASPEDLAS